MIRYFGAYARRSKRKYGAKVQSGIRQLNLYSFGLERINRCPFCRDTVEFVYYLRKPPPKKLVGQTELKNWISGNLIGGGGICQRS